MDPEEKNVFWSGVGFGFISCLAMILLVWAGIFIAMG
jgi:hypothetical protein